MEGALCSFDDDADANGDSELKHYLPERTEESFKWQLGDIRRDYLGHSFAVVLLWGILTFSTNRERLYSTVFP